MADPRNERVLTLDKNPKQLFDAWKAAGKVPAEYGSFQELEDAYKQLLSYGMTEKAAREKLGAIYKNVDGQNLLQKNIASDGSQRALNKRAIRTDLNIGTENHLLNRGGQEALKARKAEILTDWNKLSKYEAQQAGIEIGKQFHRGHVVAGLEGGSLGIENMWPEQGTRNVLHGSAPRLPMDVIEELQIPKNDTETIYNRILEAEGLAAPRVSNALMIAADEQMVDPYPNRFKPNNIKGPQDLKPDSRGYQRNKAAGRSPESMLATQNLLDDLAEQGMSPQAIENVTRSFSATLSKGDAVAQSGPVKVVQTATKRPVNVIPPGSKRAKPQLTTNLAAIPKLPSSLMKAGAVVAGVLPIFDAADVFAGTMGATDSTKSKGDRLASAFQGVSGATGLASLNPLAAPITAPISLATAGLSAATQRRADMDKPKAKPTGYGQGTSGVTAQIKPITNHNRASLKPTPNVSKHKTPVDALVNELKWGGSQLLKILGGK